MAKKVTKSSGKKPQTRLQTKPAPAPQVQASSQRSALKTAHIVVPKKSAQRNEDEQAQAYTGVLEDRDECKDFEGDHAHNSPKKNGRRADNKASYILFLLLFTETVYCKGLG